jgi:hypothetical protein
VQLNPRPVDWQKVVDAIDQGRFADVMQSDEVDTLYLEDPPWNNDSCVEYMHAAEVYEAIEKHLSPRTQAAGEAVAALINEDMVFPNDLGDDVASEIIVGALAPTYVAELADAFAAIDYGDLETAFERHVPAKLRASLSAGYDGHAMADYLRLWHQLLTFAKERRAGVLIELS